ncbi:MAG: NADH-quinone oxidoreductase subunit J [Ignavibacteriae bacterium]|nr:NADH-quinone oxidoreductase subunit J [Ignavibacteriota bacterium]
MNVEIIFFFLIAALAILSAILMITRRNPIMSVLYLIVNFFSLAVMYLLLHAQFIAIIQILVYAGAIMVLFLFVIMLLNLGDEARLTERPTLKKMIAVGLTTVVLLQLLVGLRLLTASDSTSLSAHATAMGTVESIGKALFTDYVLPFEITSVILLAAMVGVIVLAKKKFQ